MRELFVITLLLKLSMFCGITLAAGGVPLPGLAYGKTTAKLNPKFISKLDKIRMRHHQMFPEVWTDLTLTDYVPGEHFDPEYEAILKDFSLKRQKNNHRQIMWHMTARVMLELKQIELQVELIQLVRNIPFHRPFPPTTAVGPEVYLAYLKAKRLFMEEIQNH